MDICKTKTYISQNNNKTIKYFNSKEVLELSLYRIIQKVHMAGMIPILQNQLYGSNNNGTSRHFE